MVGMITHTNRIKPLMKPRLVARSGRFGQCSPVLSMEEAMVIQLASRMEGKDPATFSKEATLSWAYAVLEGEASRRSMAG
jgi:hypothetical protein